jgi:nitroimidazol reductase NimA-like FMN-containing flavoprotein (pyridoxamine 5'-phosphate oxidase superfamily)
MRREEKEINDKDHLTNLLLKGKFATLSLCRENEPYIVSMNYGFDRDHFCLYFHCAKKGLKLDFIKANSSVCGTVIHDKGYLIGECDHSYESVVFWGKMYLVKDLNEKKHALESLIVHLEEKPSKMKKKMLKSEKIYERVNILKLEIESISGKKGPVES